MTARIEPFVTSSQELIVTCHFADNSNLQLRANKPMIENEKLEFSKRLNEALDGLGVPPKHQGRQQALVDLLKPDLDVSQKGARKWLEGEGFPGMENAVILAKKVDISVEWLLTGRGPKRPGVVAIDLSDLQIGLAQRWVKLPKNLRDHILSLVYFQAYLVKVHPHLAFEPPEDYEEFEKLLRESEKV